MDNLSDVLSICAQEPIQFLGKTQPHGCLVACNPASYKILYVSENSLEFFALTPIQLFRKPITALLSQKAIEEVEELIQTNTKNIVHYSSWNLPYQDTTRLFHVNLHINNNNYVIIELEFMPELLSGNYLSDIRYTIERFAQVHTLESYYRLMVEEIQQITEYNRVMLYRFDKNWHGEVIAESTLIGENLYLGSRFPASDIPPQARELYVRNKIRMIVNTGAKPINLVSQLEQILDLSFSNLRSVSPVHIEYLKNMEVMSSMSISIIIKNKLWGLIACHHDRPKYIDQMTRQLAEVLGKIFSERLSVKFEEEEKEQNIQLDKIYNELVLQTTPNLDIVNGLLHHQTYSIFDLCQCTGVIIYFERKLHPKGNVPSNKSVLKIIHWLNRRNFFETQHLAQHLPELAHEKLACGIMAIHFGNENYVIWFRHEVIQNVKWAGDPNEKHITRIDKQIKISPRKSFKDWKEIVRQHSTPWKNTEIQIVQKLRLVLIDFVLRLYEKIKKSNDYLKENNQKLRLAKEKAEEISQAKTRLLATMSHEIRTPINGILGLANVIAQAYPSDKELLDHLQLIEKSGYRLLSNITDILDLSKMESSHLKTHIATYDLKKILQENLALLEGIAQPKNIALKLTVPQPYYVKADESLLHQVLNNIIGNAIKFTDKGEVEVKLLEGSGFVIIQVQDTGTGIDSDFLPKLFHPFERENDDLKPQYEGTGLGLMITKQMMEKMNGQIEVKSTKGKGSTFRLFLPKVDALPTTSLVNKLRILIVEDDEINTLIMTKYLKDFSYDLACNSKEAFKKLDTQNYHLVLTDINLKDDEITGTEIMKFIKQNYSTIKVVAVTGYVMPQDIQDLLEAGFDAYLSKPVKKEHLLTKIQELIS